MSPASNPTAAPRNRQDPAARTRTSGPACHNNTPPPRTTPVPAPATNETNSGVGRRAARPHDHLPSRETSQPTPTGTAPENNPGLCRPTHPVTPTDQHLHATFGIILWSA